MRDLRWHALVLIGIGVVAAVLAYQPDFFLSLGAVCVLRRFLHINCPFCGMTRDFVAMAQGRFAFRNPFSPLAAVAMLVLYPAAVFRCWRSRRDFPLLNDWGRTVVVTLVLLMLVLNNVALRRAS